MLPTKTDATLDLFESLYGTAVGCAAAVLDVELVELLVVVLVEELDGEDGDGDE